MNDVTPEARTRWVQAGNLFSTYQLCERYGYAALGYAIDEFGTVQGGIIRTHEIIRQALNGS